MPNWVKTGSKWVLWTLLAILALAIPIFGVIYYRNAFLKERAKREALHQQAQESVKAEGQKQALEEEKTETVEEATVEYVKTIEASEERIEEILKPAPPASTPGSRIQDLIDKGEL